jgi:hypothetical protein
MKKIMLLGSGELGKEFTIAAQRYGQHVIAVDSYTNAPAMQVAQGPGLGSQPCSSNMLAGAATGTGMDDLHWAYSSGLCLLGRCEREPALVRYGATSRRPRPAHRRGGRDDPDVPC